jgi:hypothetical protein
MTVKDPYGSLEKGTGFELKPLAPDAIPHALERADRYRLLNEPREAESICLDILGADPGNRKALTTLVLALTDQFSRASGVDIARARELLPRLREECDRAYYAGVICERWAKARLLRGESAPVVRAWFVEAMSWYEKAQHLEPASSGDAVLRWNACARILMRDERLHVDPGEETTAPEDLEDDEMPSR